MLTITQEAATLLVNERMSRGAPNTYGVRLSALTADEAGVPELAITFVAEALPGDQVTEQEGLRAFVAPEVSHELEDATLDATPTNGTPPQLLLRH